MYLKNPLAITELWKKIPKNRHALVFFRPPAPTEGKLLRSADLEAMRLYLGASGSVHFRLVQEGLLGVMIYPFKLHHCQIASMLTLGHSVVMSPTGTGYSRTGREGDMRFALTQTEHPRIILVCGNPPICNFLEEDPDFEKPWVTVLCVFEDGKFKKIETGVAEFGGDRSDELTNDAPV